MIEPQRHEVTKKRSRDSVRERDVGQKRLRLSFFSSCLCGYSSTVNSPFHYASDFVDPDPLLLERVAIADGDGLILQRLAIDGDAVRRADFVLPAVAAADGGLLVVEHVE